MELSGFVQRFFKNSEKLVKTPVSSRFETTRCRFAMAERFLKLRLVYTDKIVPIKGIWGLGFLSVHKRYVISSYKWCCVLGGMNLNREIMRVQ